MKLRIVRDREHYFEERRRGRESKFCRELILWRGLARVLSESASHLQKERGGQIMLRGEQSSGRPTCLGWKLPLRSQFGMGMMNKSSWVRLCEAARRSRARCSSLWQEPWGWGQKSTLLSRCERQEDQAEALS